jgi:hypothetical protein
MDWASQPGVAGENPSELEASAPTTETCELPHPDAVAVATPPLIERLPWDFTTTFPQRRKKTVAHPAFPGLTLIR